MKRFAALLGLLVIGMAQPARATDALPQEIEALVADSGECDHWRGEPAFNKQREAEINWNVCQTCLGIGARLNTLRKKHTQNPAALAALSDIQPIDSDPALRSFCRKLKKPRSPSP